MVSIWEEEGGVNMVNWEIVWSVMVALLIWSIALAVLYAMSKGRIAV